MEICAVGLGLQALEGPPCRRLLGFFLGATLALAPHGAGQLDAGPEVLLVLGTVVGQYVSGQLPESVCCELLQT